MASTLEHCKELTTLQDFIRWGMSRFNAAELHYGHGTDNSWDEVLQLVLFSLHLPLNLRPELLNAHLTTEEKKALTLLFKRRIEERVPVPYLTHKAFFAGLEFYVDNRVLIPRSSIAELIENYFQPWIETEKVNRVLDLCTGSGCIAIAIAHYFPDAIIDASDISTDALAVAEINRNNYGLASQLNLIQSDLFTAIPAQQYDIIVSNPPYVSKEAMADVPPEYQHEPALALAGGPDGLDLVEKILLAAPRYLSSHGILVVEVGESEQALVERFPEVPFLWLEFNRGEQGVFLLTAEQVQHYFGDNKKHGR